MVAVASDGAAAAEQQLPRDADSSKVKALFSQSKFADEMTDWLQNRAAPAEAQRYQRYMDLVQQAAVGCMSHQDNNTRNLYSSKHRPASTLGFHVKKAPQAPAAASTACRPSTANLHNSSWYTSTVAAAAKLSSTSKTLPADGLTSTGLRPRSSPAASASALAADLQQPADDSIVSGRARKSAAAAKPVSACSPKCVNITTTQAGHGLKELYPDLWASTVPICRPDPAPNKNFVSEWGESLRQGAGEAWAPYLATTYQLANLQVAKPTDEFAVRGDEALIDWAAKQKLYFGEVLTPQAAAAVQALLDNQSQQDIPAASDTMNAASLSLADKKGLLEVLRQVNAVVQPDRGQSVTKTVHRPQYSVEQPETTALMKEQTRIKTMGFPRRVEVKGFVQTATKTAAAAAAAAAKDSLGTQATATAAAEGASAASQVDGSSSTAVIHGSCDARRETNGIKGTRKLKASEMVDTFSSKVPLKWAASAVHAPTSSYTASYGGNPGHAPQMFKTVFQEVNVGFGHVDQHMYPTSSGVYPVEQRYLHLHPTVEQDQKDLDMKTTQRMSYKPRDPKSVARTIVAAREQIEASQAARNKSFIPLSKAGVQMGSSAQWRSVYGSEFIPRKADLSANRAMASAVAGMFNGPTIAFGKIAGFRAEDSTRIARHKAQEQALAAAKASAEAELDKRVAAAAGNSD